PVALRVGTLPPILPVTARMALVPVPDSDQSRWLVDIIVNGAVDPGRVPALLVDQFRAVDDWIGKVRDSLVVRPAEPATPPGHATPPEHGAAPPNRMPDPGHDPVPPPPAGSSPEANAVRGAIHDVVRDIAARGGSLPGPLGSGTWASTIEAPAGQPVQVRFLDGSAAQVILEPAELPGGPEARIVFPLLVFGTAPYGEPTAPVRIRLNSRLGALPAALLPGIVRRSLFAQFNEVHNWLTTRPEEAPPDG